MNDKLTEADIQCLAQIIAMIPGIAMPPDTTARLRRLALIAETPRGWAATDQGVLTVVNWTGEA